MLSTVDCFLHRSPKQLLTSIYAVLGSRPIVLVCVLKGSLACLAASQTNVANRPKRESLANLSQVRIVCQCAAVPHSVNTYRRNQQALAAFTVRIAIAGPRRVKSNELKLGKQDMMTENCVTELAVVVWVVTPASFYRIVRQVMLASLIRLAQLFSHRPKGTHDPGLTLAFTHAYAHAREYNGSPISNIVIYSWLSLFFCPPDS